MIRKVAFRKALTAGAAGAVAWELAARLLGAMAGGALFDIVHLLGTLFAPDASPALWWPVGMMLHMLVGAIWAVFYAYFFWSEFALRPWQQGLLFSLLPLFLATFVMRPQLELMHPLVLAGRLPFSGLYGLSASWRSLAGIALGHFVWGATLGALYVRPSGLPRGANPLRDIRQPRKAHRRGKAVLAPQDFMFATGIECSYPTIDGGRLRIDQMAMSDHYRRWREDLQLVGEVGLRYLRYGPPLHLILQGAGRCDWTWMDEVMAEMRLRGIVPLIDLCHFGLPDWLGTFQNPELVDALSFYAAAFAERYLWVRHYTPINEMYVCARMSALDGAWNEQLTSEKAFVTACRHLACASVSIREAILAVRPDAVFINNESSEFFQPCCPDQGIQSLADFENERRFLPLDLVHARPLSEAMRRYVSDHGFSDSDYQWFMSRTVPERSILGVDYYWSNEKLINAEGRPEALGELFGWYVIASEYYRRYGRPLMHTETNLFDAREAPRWLWRQWHNVELMRRNGIPVLGFTWYSLLDQIDWDVQLRADRGVVNPVGLFDLNRDPRSVALSYRELVRSQAEIKPAETQHREWIGTNAPLGAIL